MNRPRPAARQIIGDLVAIAAVALLLVAVHLLVPFGFRDRLALWYAAPDPVAAFTAAYVHVDTAHLTGNVVGYLVGAGMAYALSLAAGERRWFRLSWLACLVILPVAVGLTSATLEPGAVVGRGFSGVVAGFAGVALMGAGVVLHRTFGVDRQTMWEVVGLLALVVAGEIIWLVSDGLRWWLAGLLIVGVGLQLGSLTARGVTTGVIAGRSGLARAGGAVAVTGVVLGVVTWFMVGLFPAQPVRASGVTNLLGHYLGLVYGGVIAAWGYRYWSVA